MSINGTNPAWSEALHAFFALYLRLAESDRKLVDELIDSVRFRRAPVLERPDWTEGFPLRGRLASLAELSGNGERFRFEDESLDRIMARLVVAMYVVRDVVDRYPLGPEDMHDYRLADLRVSQVVSELRRRYSGRGARRLADEPPRSIESDLDARAPERAAEPAGSQAVASVAVVPGADPATPADKPKRGGWSEERRAAFGAASKARWEALTPEQRAERERKRQESLEARRRAQDAAVSVMQSMPQLRPAQPPVVQENPR